jgi:hypothetical protein
MSIGTASLTDLPLEVVIAAFLHPRTSIWSGRRLQPRINTHLAPASYMRVPYAAYSVRSAASVRLLTDHAMS